MTYDALGNITSKTGLGSYGLGAQSANCPAGALDKAHAVVSTSSASYCYDRNGNMQTGAGWTYTWNADNTLSSMTNGTAPESYLYDADGERVVRTAANITTVFFEGVWEQTTAGARKLYYTFNGQVVAMRDSTTNTVTYLHGDHLGSVSVATNSTGTGYSTQEFDPWGKVRAGSIGATSMNYTGQRLDATGLLYYHARYYNPVLARFVSADSVVPGNASGDMDGVTLKGLTVDFHEPGFATQIGSENDQPFWFQMSEEQRQKAGDPWGPANPQALNRYSYVLNGPMRWTDPSGHAGSCNGSGGASGGDGCGGSGYGNGNTGTAPGYTGPGGKGPNEPAVASEPPVRYTNAQGQRIATATGEPLSPEAKALLAEYEDTYAGYGALDTPPSIQAQMEALQTYGHTLEGEELRRAIINVVQRQQASYGMAEPIRFQNMLDALAKGLEEFFKIFKM